MYQNIIISAIEQLVRVTLQEDPLYIAPLPKSGSDRAYFRIQTPAETFIATYNENVQENETFFYITEHFLSKGLPVPSILAINKSKTIYIQKDLGKTSLLDVLEFEGHSENVYNLFKKTILKLAEVQVIGHQNFDYSKCLTSKDFGKDAIFSDLLYFKYYFLDTLKLAYDKQRLLNDFETLAVLLTDKEYHYFLYRDCQSRNIMVQENEVYFIDYQGGMQGALQYDVAALLWQAKANLPQEWKDTLLTAYIEKLKTLIIEPIDLNKFKVQYNGYVLIRLLQVLGAYGFRGIFERKAHFLTSIPLALNNLKIFLATWENTLVMPELEKVLNIIISKENIDKFQPVQANKNTLLIVDICSFSYKKGYPENNTGNGGGFIFDCRGILNPGRFEPYKRLTGRDKPVKDFLEQQTLMPDFLNNIYNTIDISVTDYIKRDFEHLSIAFGCTGGQHRSVYATDAMARHLKNKFNVKVNIRHLVQDAKNWINDQ